MKALFYIWFFIGITSFAQGKYLTKTGMLGFEASVPSFEEVEALNQSVTAIIDTETGEIAVLALVKGFRFKNALMEEHFNENYAESNKFPKATFKGVAKGFSMDGPSKSTIKGDLTFHGTTKSLVNIPVTIQRNGDTLMLEGKFQVSASDFNIDIPKIVRNKIAEVVDVHFNFELTKK